MTTQQLSTPICGANVDVASSSAPYTDLGLGTRILSISGNEYMKVKANGAIDQYDAVVVDETLDAIVASLTTTATAFGQVVGVAMATAADNEDLWVQIGGVGVVNVLASCAANVVLNSTATDGQLDDDATAGSEDIAGIILTTACGGAAAATACVITNPTVGVTN